MDQLVFLIGGVLGAVIYANKCSGPSIYLDLCAEILKASLRHDCFKGGEDIFRLEVF